MKRRTFIKTGTGATAAGLVGSLEMTPLIPADQKPEEHVSPDADNRPADYLKDGKESHFLPQSPAFGKVYPVESMPLQERLKRKIVPQHGFCSITPGTQVTEALISGNGSMSIELLGDPLSEQIMFHHESLLMPWKRPVEAPNVADIFPLIRQMILDGKNREAVALAMDHLNKSAVKQDTEPHLTIPAFLMKLDIPKSGPISNYLRTVDFESGELNVVWNDEKGEWSRKTFTSRPDNAVVQLLTAPEGKTLNASISLHKSSEWIVVTGMDWGALKGIGSTDPDMAAFKSLAEEQKKLAPKGVETVDVKQDINENRLIYKCRLDASVDKSGYAGVTRVVRNGGSARVNGDKLIIENSSSVMLITRIAYFKEFNEAGTEALRKDVEAISPDYKQLLERHRAIQSEMLKRVKVDFGGTSQYGKSSEELLAEQLARPDFSPAILEKIFEMGRYWFIINSGKYPSIAAGVNSTINLQTAGAVEGDMKEGMEAYFNWMEEIADDCRVNAKNIFGINGTVYPLFPDKGMGANFYYTSGTNAQVGIWPYWISAGGLSVRQLWDHYLVTGDKEFLGRRVIPAFRELAQFYEEFLTVTDSDGNYIFVPSISPENTSRNTDPSGPVMVNAAMDIAVCREVLTSLIQACEITGTEKDNVTKWKTMLSKLPPYLLETDGTLKEWSWPTIEEHYPHRHVSHLYGVWPGNEIDPDRTPQLAMAAKIANRRRTFDVMATAVAGETLAAYFRCHRALVGARLKDNVIVDTQLRQLIEQGYLSTAFRFSREPRGIPIPDAQAAFPAITIEMLLYSRPGIIEILPALPDSLLKGTISGVLAKTFARIDNLSWDMDERSASLIISSLKTQDITLIARHGIADIKAPEGVLGASFRKGLANADLHLKENQPVELKIMLGNQHPSDWYAL